MRLILAAAIIIGIFGVALATVPAQALPVLPSQCPGVIGDYNVIDKTGQATFVQGTSAKDFILVGNGIVNAGEGDDCVVVTTSQGNAIVFGEAGNDVLISKRTQSGNAGQAYGDYQIQYPIYEWVPEGCDPDVDDPCVQVPFSLPEGNADRCVGKWAYRQGCELN